jgi:hypothetical protein
VGLLQIVGPYWEMAASGIHAAQHDLIIQHQLVDQFSSSWNTVSTYAPVQSQSILEVELECFGTKTR